MIQDQSFIFSGGNSSNNNKKIPLNYTAGKKIQLLTPVFLSSPQPSFFQTQFFRAKMLGTDNCTVSYAVWCKEITRESDMFFLDSTADG